MTSLLQKMLTQSYDIIFTFFIIRKIDVTKYTEPLKNVDKLLVIKKYKMK